MTQIQQLPPAAALVALMTQMLNVAYYNPLLQMRHRQQLAAINPGTDAENHMHGLLTQALKGAPSQIGQRGLGLDTASWQTLWALYQELGGQMIRHVGIIAPPGRPPQGRRSAREVNTAFEVARHA